MRSLFHLANYAPERKNSLGRLCSYPHETARSLKIYMSRPSLADIPDDAIIRFNDTDVVTGSAGYNLWWSKEYERREANDL